MAGLAGQADGAGVSPGQRLFGRYVLEAWCGRGAQGEVWRARDELLGQVVALKLVPNALDPECLKQEVRQARTLAHPHIVRIHDYAEEGGMAAIAMEYVDGGSLAARRFASPDACLSAEEVASWLPQLCAALDYAHHEVGLVHRDIKPANLLLTREGRLKVADFGVASSLRAMGTGAAGTTAYMSPQQAMGAAPVGADDIYAVGVTLHELLTGHLPGQGGNLPSPWREVVAACLQSDPRARPASVGRVAATVLGDATMVEALRQPPEVPTEGKPRRAFWLIVAGVTLATTGGLLAWRGKPPPLSGMPGYEQAVGNPVGRSEDAPWLDLPLAGDGWSRRGGDPGARLQGVRPAADRYGLPGRALSFAGSGVVSVPMPENTALSSRDAWAMAWWMRTDGGTGREQIVAELGGDALGSFAISVSLRGGRLQLVAGRRLHTISICETSFAVAAGQWHHVVAAGDGTNLWLWVDGHLVQSAPYTAGEAPAAAGGTLTLGRPSRFRDTGLVGALAEFRLYRRLLGAMEIRALAHEAPDFSVRPPPALLSEGYYAETDDLDPALEAEFGVGARLADWQDVAAACVNGEQALALASRLGLKSGDNALITYRGARWFSADRHYFLSRLDGQRPAYYLAHEQIGDQVLALGSWHGLKMRALVRYPGASLPVPWEARPDWPAGEDSVDLALPAASGSVLVLQHRQMVSPGSESPVRVELGPRAGEVGLVFQLAGRPDGGLRLEVRADGQSRWHREIGASYGALSQTLVLGEGRAVWRLEKAGAPEPLWQEEIALPGLRLGEQRAVRWISSASLRDVLVRIE